MPTEDQGLNMLLLMEGIDIHVLNYVVIQMVTDSSEDLNFEDNIDHVPLLNNNGCTNFYSL